MWSVWVECDLRLSLTGRYSLGFSFDHPPWIFRLSATPIEYQWGSAARKRVMGSEATEMLGIMSMAAGNALRVQKWEEEVMKKSVSV